MRVYVIRHGESVNNNLKKWTGWFDAPLTEKGYQDARYIKEFLSGVKIDKVYSSDLSRSIETSKTAMPNREIETTPLLREINLGSMENRPWTDMTAEQKERGVAVGYKEFGG
jgi:broad specificity phosphatase PhoE